MKLCTCFSALLNSSFRATTATRRAVQQTPCGHTIKACNSVGLRCDSVTRSLLTSHSHRGQGQPLPSHHQQNYLSGWPEFTVTKGDLKLLMCCSTSKVLGVQALITMSSLYLIEDLTQVFMNVGQAKIPAPFVLGYGQSLCSPGYPQIGINPPVLDSQACSTYHSPAA